MAVFMDTGGGDIYAGETREACIAAMFLTVCNQTRALDVLKGVPAGAKFISVMSEPNPFESWVRTGRTVDLETVWLTFEHESFPEKEEGCYPETLEVLISARTDPAGTEAAAPAVTVGEAQ